MKRIRNMVIGGIQNKIFNLILFTVILISAVSIILSWHQSKILSKLSAESAESQQLAITEIITSVMDQVVTLSLERSSKSEARVANEMFDTVQGRVAYLADYAGKLFAHPENYLPQFYSGPDAGRDGEWTAQMIYADGVDPEDPEIIERAGLLANLSEMMVSLCPAFGSESVYIAIPEGVHLSVTNASASWLRNGVQVSYDARQRQWYRQAVEAGGLIFTEGELDAITNIYCIECAAPVYGPDGNLVAVVGTDLFLDEMQNFLRESVLEGECLLLLNENGRVVLNPQDKLFPMANDDRGKDLRQSSLEVLAQVVNDAMQGKDPGVLKGQLKDGVYYVTATQIDASGWVLISAYNQESVNKPAAMLGERSSQIQMEAVKIYQEKTKQTSRFGMLMLIGTTVLMLAGAIVLGTRISRPLNIITRRISELKEGNLEFKMEDAYRTGDEVEELAQSFATLSHKTVEYVETVKQVTAEKERIGTELSLATQIQASMLPHIFPAFPDRSDFDVMASMDPAKEVGGDFYDYFLVDDDHLCLVMADVSGKGVPAALFMMASKIIQQSVAMLGKSPAEILSKTNEAICSNNDAQMFVTVWLGILELSTGKMTAANAGHEYPVIKHPGMPFELYKDKHGFVIGGIEGARYREYEVQLEPGSKLFVYTDGVPEATNAEQELFGTDRMLAALNEEMDAAPQKILKNVRRAVDQFVGDAEQFDDLTMLCFEYKGRSTIVDVRG